MTLGTDRGDRCLADPGPWPYRVIQIHPSLRCNLSCRHCYSSSGPSRTETLPRELVETLVVDAAAQAYDAISVSGGEPLMWPGLRDTLALAKACGLATALTTNLIPLTSAPPRWARAGARRDRDQSRRDAAIARPHPRQARRLHRHDPAAAGIARGSAFRSALSLL